MILIEDKLDYSSKWELPDVYLFTGNAYIKTDGSVVMGKGAAKQVKNNYPHIPRKLGNIIKEANKSIYLPAVYKRVLFVLIKKDQFIGWFQVKWNYSEHAKINLIKESTNQLKKIANTNKHKTYHMNFPGIGNGKLEFDPILRIIEKLPDNVLIYK